MTEHGEGLEMGLEQDLERFVVETFGRRRGRPSIGPNEDLIGDGIIDSLGLTELVAFIEQRFGVTVDDDDVVIDNFRNIRSMESFIEGKRASAK
jgi:acyl carrier protein